MFLILLQNHSTFITMMFASLISMPTEQIFTASSETEMVPFVNLRKSALVLCIDNHIIWRMNVIKFSTKHDDTSSPVMKIIMLSRKY